MNTRISYLYRDGDNYKQSHEVVVSGELTLEQIQPFLLDGENFIASQVGLQDIQTMWKELGFEFPTDQDHVFCEMEDMEFTEEKPTSELTASQLLFNFQKVDDWNILETMEKLGL